MPGAVQVTAETKLAALPEPEEDLSAQHLAEALKSIPSPDWEAIAALAETQKQILMELSAFSNISHDLRERAGEWEMAASEVRQDASQLEAYRNDLSARIQAPADSLKTEADFAGKLMENAPEVAPVDLEDPVPAEPAKPELPSGAELVARLMALAKRKA